jgi:Icc-related predicted phosphoesterase
MNRSVSTAALALCVLYPDRFPSIQESFKHIKIQRPVASPYKVYLEWAQDALRAQKVSTKQVERVRILHLSDTHMMHHQIEAAFPLPEADILVHTGDFSNRGSVEEFESFNDWIGTLRPRFRAILIICGNHDLHACGPTDPRQDPAFIKASLSNATHVLLHESVTVCGITFYGSSWVPEHDCENPGDGPVPHLFHKIPYGIDILLTHGAPYGILDLAGPHRAHWGGSRVLRAGITY